MWCSDCSAANSSVPCSGLTVPSSGSPAGRAMTSTSVSLIVSSSSSTVGLSTAARWASVLASASICSWARELSGTCPTTTGRSRISAHTRRAMPEPRVSRLARSTSTRVPSASRPASRLWSC